MEVIEVNDVGFEAPEAFLAARRDLFGTPIDAALAVSAAVGSLFRSTAISTTVTYVVVIGLFLAPILVWLGREACYIARPSNLTACSR